VRSTPGDVLEVAFAPGKVAYLRYLGKDRLQQDIIEVLQDFGRKACDLDAISRMHRDYAFCSYFAGLRRSSATKYVGNTGPPSSLPSFRAQGLTGWHLPDGRVVTELDEASAQLPILEGIPESVVLKRLREGWLPQFDTMNLATRMSAAIRSNDAPALRTVIRFSDAGSAEEAVKALRKEGYNSTSDGTKLVIRSKQSIDFDDARKSQWLVEHSKALAEIYKQFGGVCEESKMESS
jgi:hypothetical protein